MSGTTKRVNSHSDLVGRGLGWAFSSNEAAPCLVTFVDDLCCVFFVLSLPRESKGVLALAIGNLIDSSGG